MTKTLENKLDIHKNLEINIKIYRNYKIKLKIYKNLQIKFEMYSYFKLENKLKIFEFFVNGRWSQYKSSKLQGFWINSRALVKKLKDLEKKLKLFSFKTQRTGSDQLHPLP